MYFGRFDKPEHRAPGERQQDGMQDQHASHGGQTAAPPRFARERKHESGSNHADETSPEEIVVHPPETLCGLVEAFEQIVEVHLEADVALGQYNRPQQRSGVLFVFQQGGAREERQHELGERLYRPIRAHRVYGSECRQHEPRHEHQKRHEDRSGPAHTPRAKALQRPADYESNGDDKADLCDIPGESKDELWTKDGKACEHVQTDEGISQGTDGAEDRDQVG
jgi:hypothetical protein